MFEIRTKQWWVENIKPILEGSKFEVKINPCENENCVIVILKEEYKEHKKKKDHYLAVKPYAKKDGFSAWMKMDVFKNSGCVNRLPEPRVHSNMAHFTNLNDVEVIFDILKALV